MLLSDDFMTFRDQCYIDFESAFGEVTSYLCRKHRKRGNGVIGRLPDFKLDLGASPLSVVEQL